MHDYKMLADKDRIIIAVSGGIDSLVLAWLLDFWKKKAPIDYKLFAVHLDMGFGSQESSLVEEQLKGLGLPYIIKKTSIGLNALDTEKGKSGCYHCARQRRNLLFEIAREKGYNKIAFGHHQEDIIETFFLNMLYSGNLSTLVPSQELFKGNLTLIRPLAYLDKKKINAIGEQLNITPVPNPCPFAKKTKREEVRKLLNTLYKQHPDIKGNIFAALGNVKPEYLLAKGMRMKAQR